MIVDDFFFSGHEAQTEVDKTTPRSKATKFRSDKAKFLQSSKFGKLLTASVNLRLSVLKL